MIVVSEEEWAKILEEFNGIGTPEDVKRFLDSGILKEKGEPLYKDRYPLYRRCKDGKILWVDFEGECTGAMIFTFDKVHFYSFYRDYPDKLTKEERELFLKENPTFKDWR